MNTIGHGASDRELFDSAGSARQIRRRLDAHKSIISSIASAFEYLRHLLSSNSRPMLFVLFTGVQLDMKQTNLRCQFLVWAVDYCIRNDFADRQRTDARWTSAQF